MSGAIPGLALKWKGVDYRCRTTMDVIMRIEDQVTLSELAHRSVQGAAKGAIPSSHISWVMFCLLQSGGAVCSAEDVWQSVKSNETDINELTKVIQFVISEVYGVAPEDDRELDKEAGEKK